MHNATRVAPGLDVHALAARHLRVADKAPVFLTDLMPTPFWFEFGIYIARSWDGPTLRQYSYTAFRFARFLRDRGVGISQLSESDIAEYRRNRTEGASNIASASWATEATVIRLVADYAVANHVLKGRPWIDVGRRNVLSGPSQRQRQPRGISEKEWFFFREVGLRGLTPDGRKDPSFDGQLPMRNVLGAQLAVSTGMRVSEFHSLMTSELTRPPDDEGGIHVTLSACAKGGYERDVYIPAAVRTHALTYIATDRAALVQRLSGKTKREHESLYIVDREDNDSAWVSGLYRGERVKFAVALIPPPLRQKTYRVRAGQLEPLALFVNRYGQMGSTSAWHRSFNDASARMRSFHDPSMLQRNVTPHTLRHTFARHMLAYLEELRVSEAGIAAGYGGIDPVVEVQRMLGHANRQTTSLYISSNGLTGAVERAFHDWTDDTVNYGDLIERRLAAGGAVLV